MGRVNYRTFSPKNRCQFWIYSAKQYLAWLSYTCIEKTYAYSKKFLTSSAADAVAIWHVTVTVWYSRENSRPQVFLGWGSQHFWLSFFLWPNGCMFTKCGFRESVNRGWVNSLTQTNSEAKA